MQSCKAPRRYMGESLHGDNVLDATPKTQIRGRKKKNG